MSKILDPQGSFLQKWNKIIFFYCVFAASLDVIFFYVPVIDGKKKCISLDRKLVIIASALRSFTDIVYIPHILFQFCTGFLAPSSRVFGRGSVLVEDVYAIARRYLSSYLIVDILAILPLPQVLVIIAIANPRGPVALRTLDFLKFVVFIQYVPRLIRFYPLYKEVTRISGLLTKTAWIGAALNLFTYVLFSHVVGGFWYLLAIEQQHSCWRIACKDHKCNDDYLYCGEGRLGDYSFLNVSCPLREPNDLENLSDFDFGIFLEAFQSHVVEMSYFPRRFFYCLLWGLRNLSSMGQNLKTSTFVGEILFVFFISIVGLVLFALLIGNMQKYLESLTNKIEQMRVRREEEKRWDNWMSKRMIPMALRERIKRYEQYKWQETRGVEEESLLRSLPKDLRRDIKRHLCLSVLSRVPIIQTMDEQCLSELCDRLKPVLYTKDMFIIREGDPVDEMFFFMSGNILTMTTNGGRTGFFNSAYLKAGDFCCEELFTWALDPGSSSSLPVSTRTVRVISDVEAFALLADDLKFVVSQFRRLHSRQLKHTFRFYSQQWRTWAACFIQAAWRRLCRRKVENSLREEEDRLQVARANEVGTSPSLGATIYASIFAANSLRAIRRNHARIPKLSTSVPLLLLRKPPEPDFSTVEDH